ncbi:hypothetical protein [Guptibacillus hwajinpoensis]|uniref:hypothetical protein n=1 Tax=Guptibacillus hwajinpoensis TaxID=208199 RepID=UPI001CFDD587|nr:hypothetical protein [Pseudalkalibacillus hwajinpoensis]WLR59147.1 hypothetical protein LC071_18670 [Pseudalkalibacillus hwajinpoensis]
MRKTILVLIIILSLPLNACSTNELEKVESVKISYWIGDEKQSEEASFSDKNIIKVFVNATNRAVELDNQKVIKTPPVLTYDLITDENTYQTFHLWVTETGEGFIQSLLLEDRFTYRLEEGAVTDLTTFLNNEGNVDLSTHIEFE